MKTQNLKTQRGLSLIELIVTMAIAAIVLGVGVPTFGNVIADNSMASNANRFVASINLARSSAVRYQRPAVICASSNYNATTPTCDAGTDWSNGWIVYVDKDRDGAVDADEVQSVFEPMDDDVSFASGAVASFTYDARGFVNNGDNLTLCDDRTGEMGRQVRVNAAGRVSVVRQVCG